MDPHLITAAAYIAIPIALEVSVWRVRPAKLPHAGRLLLVLFEAFIFACAIDHITIHQWPEWAGVTGVVEAVISVITAVVLATNTVVIRDALNMLMPDVYESELFGRVFDLMGLGRTIWLKDGTLRMDAIARRNLGIRPLPEGVEWRDDVIGYDEWADAVGDPAEIAKAQEEIGPVLADGGASHQLVRYANGRTVYGGGTARANGYAWAGVNIDVSSLVELMQNEGERRVEVATAAAERRAKAEVDKLNATLSIVRTRQRDRFIAQAAQDHNGES